MFFLSGIFDIWYWILSTWGIHYLLTPLQNSLSRNKQHSGVKRLFWLYFFSASHTFEQDYALFFCRFQNCQSTASQLLARHKSRFKGNSLIDKMPAMMPAQTDWEVSYKSNMLQCTCVIDNTQQRFSIFFLSVVPLRKKSVNWQGGSVCFWVYCFIERSKKGRLVT